MGFFKNLFGIGGVDCDVETFNAVFGETELTYKRLALEIAIDLVANSIARADWKQFENKEHVEKSLYYKLNVATNETETSTEFFKHYTKRMMLDGEVLIYPDTLTGNLYIADSFSQIPVSFNRFKYENISINNQMLKKTLSQEEVIYLQYNQDNIRAFMDSYVSTYNKLIDSAVYGYQSNKTRRFMLDSKMFKGQTNQSQQDLNTLMAQNLADFASSTAGSKIYAKSNDWEVKDMSDSQIESANDSRRFIRDIYDIVANTYHIPVQMIMTSWENTEVTQNVIDNYLVNAVFPMIDLFKEGLNRYNYSENEYLTGNKVQPDLTKVRLTDLKTIGTFIAQVFPTGALSLNDIVDNYLHLDKLPEELGDTRVITKNYQNIDDFKAGIEPDMTGTSFEEKTTIETEENV